LEKSYARSSYRATQHRRPIAGRVFGLLGLLLVGNMVRAADLDLSAYRGKVVYLDFWASIHGSGPTTREFFSGPGWHSRRLACPMVHLRALVFMDLHGRHVYRVATKQPGAERCIGRDHRRGRRSDRKSINLVCSSALFGVVSERQFGRLIFQLPALGTLNVAALILAIAAALAMLRFKAGMIATLLGCSIAGILMYVAGWPL
jgi:hypothetical protein